MQFWIFLSCIVCEDRQNLFCCHYVKEKYIFDKFEIYSALGIIVTRKVYKMTNSTF